MLMPLELRFLFQAVSLPVLINPVTSLWPLVIQRDYSDVQAMYFDL
jgi:hypothetical protein